MKIFTDSKNKEWKVELNIGVAKQVKELLGVNLLEPEAGEPPLLTRLGTDEFLLIDVIYCLCKQQADHDGVSDEQFGAGLGGEAVLAAQTAFYEELLDFFQSRGRTDRAKAVQKQMQLIGLAVQRAEALVSNIDLETQLDKTFGPASGNLPEPSASTPGL